MNDNAVYRILDANFNRSREALRVMEEYARFVLDDAALTEAMKAARHDLAAAVKGLESGCQGESPRRVDDPTYVPGREVGRSDDPSGSTPLLAAASPRPDGRGTDWLVAHRDIVGDVGRVIGTPSESQRTDPSDVVTAAGKRLAESLRVMEEYGKILDPRFAATIEQLRYLAYELERRLFATLRARERFGDVRLYVIVTEALCRGDWFETARAALSGGADCLQLREKNLPDRQLLGRAKRLSALCREMDRLLIINDRPDIALAANAHGVHLGQDDLPVAAARRLLPASMLVGASTHTLEQFEAALAAAPDYIAVGPMFESPTKPQDHIAGPSFLAQARSRTSLPLAAIGGIRENNLPEILALRPWCVCVCGAVLSATDPQAAAASLRRAVDAHFSSEKTPQ